MGVVLAFAPVTALAQSAALRAYVPNKEVVQDRPFWLIVEASGASVETPRVTQGDGVVINTSSPQRTTQFQIGGGQQQQTVRLSYSSTAIRPGRVTIPPVKARINGQLVQTEPIVLDVKPAPDDANRARNVRAWVSSEEVTVGKPFWIFIEATGMEIDLPETLSVDGLSIDPRNSQRSTSFSFGRQGQRTTEKRGFHAIPVREGTIRIPPIEVRVTGRIVKTDPIDVVAKAAPIQTPGTPSQPADGQELTQDDLVFIRMETDKQAIYQGEAVLLSMQLWRIQNRRITSGPYRGALIVSPTTEGFFVRELDALQYDAPNGPWTYDVTETRKLLYPTRTGTLTVGRWHWEGIALINRQSIVMRDKLYYKLDAGPIDIDVKPLPPAPEGFTGAVGQFDVAAELGQTIAKQGVPTALTVTVAGFGNPDAVGDPRLPALSWADVREPQREVALTDDAERIEPRLEKTFTFAVTPLRAGKMTIPEFVFVHFDPEQERYVTDNLGPFDLDVLASEETESPLVSSPDVPIAERTVAILAEDIRPVMERTGSLEAGRDRSYLWVPLVAAPVVVYGALALVLARRRRILSDVGWARFQQARTKGLRRLRDVGTSAEPADTLYRALAAFVADTLNLEEEGLTSADVRREMDAAALPDDLARRIVQILKACERARYGSQQLSRDEVNALIAAAEACMNDLDSVAKRERRT